MDQAEIPKPKVGDRVSVYGVWVEDREFAGIVGTGWHEIHPVRYIEINGKKYGAIPYAGSLFDGVHNPQRFVILDPENPYRIANGTVADVFTNPLDGDYHVHLLVDEEYHHLLKIDYIILLPYYTEPLRLLSILPVAVMIAYVVTSFVRPRYTLLGRLIFFKR